MSKTKETAWSVALEASALALALRWAERAAGAALDSGGGMVFLSGTAGEKTLEVQAIAPRETFRCRVRLAQGAPVESSFSVALRAKYCARIIGAAVGPQVELRGEHGSPPSPWLRVLSGASDEFLLPVRVMSGEAPAARGATLATHRYAAAGELAQVLRAVSFAASADESRPALQAVNLRSIDGEAALHAVATDTARLALYGDAAAKVKASVSIHADDVSALESSLAELGDEPGSVDVELREKRVSVAFRGSGESRYTLAQWSFATVEAGFPEWQHVLPDVGAGWQVVAVDPTKLLDGLKRAALVLERESHYVRLKTIPGALELVASTPDVGESRVVVEAEVSAEPAVDGRPAGLISLFSAPMLRDIAESAKRVSAAADGKLKLELTWLGGNGIALWTCGDLLVGQMPVRTNSPENLGAKSPRFSEAPGSRPLSFNPRRLKP
jgi:hypothetical protein